jgi:hypothetical protein
VVSWALLKFEKGVSTKFKTCSDRCIASDSFLGLMALVLAQIESSKPWLTVCDRLS